MEIKYGRKRSGIKKELDLKVTEWLASIEDEKVQKAAAEDVIVTGGAIASMLLGDQVNDFDVYFKTKQTTKLVAEYYVNKFNEEHNVDVGDDVKPILPFVEEVEMSNIKGQNEERVVIYIKSAGVVSSEQETYKYFESQSAATTEAFADSLKKKQEERGKYTVSFMSQNAITLTDKMQIIIRFYGEPEKIHDNYDFIHAMCYWDHAKKDLVLPAESLEALLSRTLIYKGSLYPIASVFRTKKFLERGWRISAGQQLKMMWQISEIDLTDFQVLREQLTGVDMAYLHQLIAALKDVEPEKINSAYVATIIDKIFD